MSNKLIFKLEQKLVSKNKSVCNKSGRSSQRDLKHLSLHFFDFSMIFKQIYKLAVLNTKRRKDICVEAPGISKIIIGRPLAGG